MDIKWISVFVAGVASGGLGGSFPFPGGDGTGRPR